VTLRVVAVLWLALGVAIWNGFFDLYVSRGAREYGQLRVEHELGRGPEPDMNDVMTRAQHDGVVGASIWAGLVVIGGWGTIWVSSKSKVQSSKNDGAM
jgi:hypothetical protein